MTTKETHSFRGAVAKRLSVVLLLLLMGGATLQVRGATASDSTRVFSEQDPLVYEDAWDLWPYVFLNEYGEAVGYNIDLLKLLLKELNIPCIIKLKPTKDALEDLKNGQSDLMFGMDAHFHNEYASYGKSVIQIFTHSVVHKKDEPAVIGKLEDLARHRVIVHAGSFSHHLMLQRGWGGNAIPYDDMQDAVQRAHHEAGTQIVWNTLSLKWLLRKFQFDDLELTPVNIQHGEYKFMSNNPRLLEQLDSAYVLLSASGQLQAIQNKWFYPERKDTGIPSWIWQVVAVLVLLTLLSLGFYVFYHRYERKMTANVRLNNNRLALLLKTSRVRLWIYHVKSRSITKFDDQANPMMGELMPVYALNDVVAEDLHRIMDALQQIGDGKMEKQTLDVEATNAEDGSRSVLTIGLSVMRRDRDGHPLEIMGTTSDVTAEKQRQQEVKNSMLRYQSIFNSVMVDTASYDEHGVMVSMNEKLLESFNGANPIKEGPVTVKDVLGMDDISLDTLDYTYLTQIFHGDDGRVLNRYLKRDELYYELQLVPLRDAVGKLQAVFGTGRDVTEVVKSHARQRANYAELERANDEISSYVRNIDFVMKNGGVRMVRYSPETHLLIVYSEIDHEQYHLTQSRLISLLSEESRKVARRVLNSMDNRQRVSVKKSVTTLIRLKGGMPLCLYVSFIPTKDTDGNIVEYFGMIRDISEIKATEKLLALETAKAQEVEMVKKAFLRNMSYEIRTPLNSVVGFAELFDGVHSADDETFFINEIKENSTRLLALINNILYISRLDAQMIEIKQKPVDFARIFEERCQSAWEDYEQPGVEYLVDNPYEHLVVDIDEPNLSVVINQIVANAAQNTTEGHVRMGYDYTGEELVLSFQDTGCGMPDDVLQHAFDRFATSGGNGTGLGLSICHDIISKMGGRISIKSKVGQGTFVWVTIPCRCSEIIRK